MSFWDRFRSNRIAEATQSAGSVDGSARTDAGRESEARTVAGERGVASIHRTRSLQSRVSNMLAAGLMSVLALGFLAWYYTQTFARQSRAEAAQTAKSKQQTKGEMVLPPLGRVDPPIVERVLGPSPDTPPVSTFALERFHQNNARPYVASSAYSPAPSITPQRTVDRRFSGPVFVTASRNATQPGEQSKIGRAHV